MHTFEIASDLHLVWEFEFMVYPKYCNDVQMVRMFYLYNICE